jgi:peptidyl-prolyl cis-trans isomerase A (cyclophilin A)
LKADAEAAMEKTWFENRKRFTLPIHPKGEGKKAENGKTVSVHTDNFLTEKFLIVHIQKKPIEFPLDKGM